jgi:hypothetical protein
MDNTVNNVFLHCSHCKHKFDGCLIVYEKAMGSSAFSKGNNRSHGTNSTNGSAHLFK